MPFLGLVHSQVSALILLFVRVYGFFEALTNFFGVELELHFNVNLELKKSTGQGLSYPDRIEAKT